MRVQAEDRVAIDPAIWEAVARAIERREVLRADYRRFDGKRGIRLLFSAHVATYIRERVWHPNSQSPSPRLRTTARCSWEISHNL